MDIKFCPKCGRLADYDPWFDRYFCTCCDWRSENIND
jgi:ribosomal protein S27AE